VIVGNLEKFLGPNFKRELRENGTGAEAHAVLLNVVAKSHRKNPKGLEPMVHRFATVSNLASFLVPTLVLHETNAARTLRRTRVFSDVSIIGLNPLLWIKTQLQCESKNLEVVPIARWEGTTDPTDVPGADVVSQLVA
jgi:hypothetical protein